MNLLVILFIYLFICFIIGILGRNFSMGFWGYFFGSILFTPVTGVLVLLIAFMERRAVIHSVTSGNK